jgi:hypothetical protein
MSILRRIRSRICALFVLAALLQPLLAPAGEKVGSIADGAFPLWTQQQDGRFIVIDTATGKYQLAPHQPDVVPGNFAYDARQDVLWLLSYTDSDYVLTPFNPHTGVEGPPHLIGSTGSIYSLTYRKSDGMLYALLDQQSILGSPEEFYVVRIVPGLSFEFVCTIQQTTHVEWKNTYFVTNHPLATLCFDPKTDVAYVTASPNAASFTFTLDLSTGETTVFAGPGSQRTIAQAFEPQSQNLYAVTANDNPPGSIGYANLASHAQDGKLIGQFPLPYSTSLAFVPKTVKE